MWLTGRMCWLTVKVTRWPEECDRTWMRKDVHLVNTVDRIKSCKYCIKRRLCLTRNCTVSSNQLDPTLQWRQPLGRDNILGKWRRQYLRVATACHEERNGNEWSRDRQRSQTVASTSSLLCGCKRRSFRTVTVEPTESVMLYDQQILCNTK